MSGAADLALPGVVKWVPLSVRTVWTCKGRRRSGGAGSPPRCGAPPSGASRRRRTSTSGRWRRAGRACLAQFEPRRGRYEIADRISLELFLGGLVAFDVRQPADPVALQAAMQRGAREMRDGRLQGIQTIVERQQCMPAECDDDCLFLDRQNCGPRLFRAGRKIGRRRTISPLAHGLLVDPVAIGQSPQALLMVWTALAPILPMKEAWQIALSNIFQRRAANGQG
jgi:hypothetical protein